MLVAKSTCPGTKTHLPPHTLSKVCCDLEVVGEESQLQLGSWQSPSKEMWWGWRKQAEDSISFLGQGPKTETKSHSRQASKGLGRWDPSQCYQWHWIPVRFTKSLVQQGPWTTTWDYLYQCSSQSLHCEFIGLAEISIAKKSTFLTPVR